MVHSTWYTTITRILRTLLEPPGYKRFLVPVCSILVFMRSLRPVFFFGTRYSTTARVVGGMCLEVHHSRGLPNLGAQTSQSVGFLCHMIHMFMCCWAPTALRASALTTSLDEEPAAPKRRRVANVGLMTKDVEQRLMDRLARGSMGSFIWVSGVRAPDIESCIKYEQRSNVLVLALVALRSCLSIFEGLKEDERRMLRLEFPNDLSPHNAQITATLYGEAVVRRSYGPRYYGFELWARILKVVLSRGLTRIQGVRIRPPY